MSCDLLVFGAHPDDAELAFGGLIAVCAGRHLSVVVVDATRGERATRGDAETRVHEAQEAARRLGVAARVQLGLPDLALAAPDLDQRHRIVAAIREHQPRLVLGPHPEEGHPDHAALALLLRDAIEEARFAGSPAAGKPHLVQQLLHAWPAAGADQGGGAGGGGGWGGGAVADVSDTFARKMEALSAYSSQFQGAGPATRLASGDFLQLVESRARIAGAAVGVRYGEGLCWRGAASLSALSLLAVAPTVDARPA